MKTLIFCQKRDLKPTGGPAGYLYNLHNELILQNNTEIEFLDTEEPQGENSFIKKIYHDPKYGLLHRLSRFVLRDSFVMFRRFLKLVNSLDTSSEEQPVVDFQQYDAIHFHNTADLFKNRRLLENYRGLVLLTSHSPKVMHKELTEDYSPKIISITKGYWNRKLEVIDDYAFNRADYIIFPCEEAEEPYYHTWKKYKAIHNNSVQKYRYLPTGICDIHIDKQIDFREKYGIPKDAFVLSYVGRHNSVKGYDQLKKIGKRVLKSNPNVYFLIGGTEKPMKGLRSPRWIEVGWTNNAHELIASSNLFILPNKETYFDLILLEVLCLGKNVLLTDTGGNKYFKQFHSDELFFYEYDDIEAACDTVQQIYEKFTRGALTETVNRNLFLDHFTIERFTRNYLEILHALHDQERQKPMDNTGRNQS